MMVMSSIRECTKLLQRRNQPFNLADVRTLFNAIIVKHDIFSGSQINSTHSIVHSPDFENGIVKIINNEEVSMTSSEKKACKMFRIEEEPVAALVDVNMAGKIDFTALLKNMASNCGHELFEFRNTRNKIIVHGVYG